MLIRIDSDVKIPSNDARFIVEDSVSAAYNGTEKQVEFDAEDLEEILNLLNRLNDEHCSVIIDYSGWLRIGF